jgi:hypothetical protein
MNPTRVVLLERVVWLVAFLCIVVALAAVDWRLGLFSAGVLLAASNVDWRRA